MIEKESKAGRRRRRRRVTARERKASGESRNTKITVDMTCREGNRNNAVHAYRKTSPV